MENNLSCEDSQEISQPIMNSELHDRVHKISELVPILRQFHKFHNVTPFFLNIHFNIILASTPLSPMSSLLFRFSDRTFTRVSCLEQKINTGENEIKNY
jgi:hypothetical protein